MTPVASRRLVYRHGSRAKRILQRLVKKPRERAIVCACEPVLEAEVRHVIAHEMARTVDDVARRTRLGLGSCGGMRCAARCGQIVADELGLSPLEGLDQARTFLEKQTKTRASRCDGARASAPRGARARADAIDARYQRFEMSAPRSVVVIGSGISGAAAALAAANAGASIRVLTGAAGASVLSGGALDFAEWSSDTPRGKLNEVAEKAFSALDFGSLPDEGILAATTAGIVRPAAGADHALLDLDRVGRGAVLVPRGDHPNWDAPVLARCWGASAVAAARAVSFVALDAQLNRFKDERVLADAEIAARHDDEARLDWLAERIREILSRNPGFVGVILPPWLGTKKSLADILSKKVGIRCGEALTGLAGPSGARFVSARDRAFAKASIDVISGWATSARASKSGWRVDLEDGTSLDADAVILATGGLVGGGLAYSPAASAVGAELPPNATATIRSTVACDVVLGERGEPVGPPSSFFGAQPEAIAWPFARDAWIERVGILVDDLGRARGAGGSLFACGDALADRPRAWLDALASGARAGANAAA